MLLKQHMIYWLGRIVHKVFIRSSLKLNFIIKIYDTSFCGLVVACFLIMEQLLKCFIEPSAYSIKLYLWKVHLKTVVRSFENIWKGARAYFKIPFGRIQFKFIENNAMAKNLNIETCNCSSDWTNYQPMGCLSSIQCLSNYS